MSSGQLEGKVAIITGAGVASAGSRRLVLAREGACVTVAEIKSPGQETVAQVTHAGGQSLFVAHGYQPGGRRARHDRGDGREVRRPRHPGEQRGGGSPKDQDILSMDVECGLRHARQHPRPMLGCKHAIPEMLKRGGGGES